MLAFIDTDSLRLHRLNSLEHFGLCFLFTIGIVVAVPNILTDGTNWQPIFFADVGGDHRDAIIRPTLAANLARPGELTHIHEKRFHSANASSIGWGCEAFQLRRRTPQPA